ncbi:hypothetical protein HYDPIDRAFT_51228, partial [Hydnomerulius pinastri MD-312]
NARIYRTSCRAMITLGADEDLLTQYKVLNKQDLKVTMAVTDPNAQGHRDDSLAWFWTMDIKQDSDMNDWMSEFFRGHWLRAKAHMHRWEEEVELLQAESGWVRNYFDHR